MIERPRPMPYDDPPLQKETLPDGWIRVRQGPLVGIGPTLADAIHDLQDKNHALPEWIHRLAAGDLSALPENHPKPPDGQE